jgi:hypothetical protein
MATLSASVEVPKTSEPNGCCNNRPALTPDMELTMSKAYQSCATELVAIVATALLATAVTLAAILVLP